MKFYIIRSGVTGNLNYCSMLKNDCLLYHVFKNHPVDIDTFFKSQIHPVSTKSYYIKETSKKLMYKKLTKYLDSFYFKSMLISLLFP